MLAANAAQEPMVVYEIMSESLRIKRNKYFSDRPRCLNLSRPIVGLIYAGKVLMIGIVLGPNYRAMTASPNRDAAGAGTLLVVTRPGHWARTRRAICKYEYDYSFVP